MSYIKPRLNGWRKLNESGKEEDIKNDLDVLRPLKELRLDPHKATMLYKLKNNSATPPIENKDYFDYTSFIISDVNPSYSDYIRLFKAEIKKLAAKVRLLYPDSPIRIRLQQEESIDGDCMRIKLYPSYCNEYSLWATVEIKRDSVQAACKPRIISYTVPSNPNYVIEVHPILNQPPGSMPSIRDIVAKMSAKKDPNGHDAVPDNNAGLEEIVISKITRNILFKEDAPSKEHALRED